MIRRLVDYILILLHLKKRDTRSALEVLLGVLSTVLCASILIGAFRYLNLYPKRRPWYKRLRNYLHYKLMYTRMRTIGY